MKETTKQAADLERGDVVIRGTRGQRSMPRTVMSVVDTRFGKVRIEFTDGMHLECNWTTNLGIQSDV